MDGGDDSVPDIYYGRIPVDNTYDATIVLNKIRTYEEIPINNSCFYNTGLHCAYFQDKVAPKKYADRRFAQTAEEVLQYVVGQGKTINRVYYTENSKTPLYWNNDKYGYGNPVPDQPINEGENSCL